MEGKNMRLLAYVYNLFAFPADYFISHTAEELGLTDEDREKLIAMQAEAADEKTVEKYEKERKDRMDAFIAEMET